MNPSTMSRSVVAMSLAGLATTVSAGLQVSLSFDQTTLWVGESITATITAQMTDVAAGSYFSSASFDLLCNQSGAVSFSALSGLDWAMPVLGAPSGGAPGADGVFGIFAAQQSLFGAVDTSNPFVIGSFTITGLPGLDLYTPLSFTVQPANSAPGEFSYTDAAGGPFAAPTYAGAEVFSSESLVWVPSPGGMLVLAAGGLVVGRRRR